MFCNLLRHDGSTRQLNHGTNRDVKFNAVLSLNLLNGVLNLFTYLHELLFKANKRNHDFRTRIKAYALKLSCSRCNGANLHNIELRIDNTKTAAAKSEHGVCFLECIKLSEKGTLSGNVLTLLFIMCNLNLKITRRIQELMQRRIKQTYDNVFAVHYLEHAKEIAFLGATKLINGKLLNILRIGQDKVLNKVLALTEEHVLGTVKTNCLCTIIKRSLCVSRIIRICTNANIAATRAIKTNLVGPLQDSLKIAGKLWLDKINRAENNITGSAVNGNDITLIDYQIRTGNGKALVGCINAKDINAADTRSAHTTGDNCSMTGLTTVGSQNTFSGYHAVKIVGCSFPTNQDARLAGLGVLLGIS